MLVKVRDAHELESVDQLAQFDGRGFRFFFSHPLGSWLDVQDSIAGVDAEWVNKVINSQLPYR